MFGCKFFQGHLLFGEILGFDKIYIFSYLFKSWLEIVETVYVFIGKLVQCSFTRKIKIIIMVKKLQFNNFLIAKILLVFKAVHKLLLDLILSLQLQQLFMCACKVFSKLSVTNPPISHQRLHSKFLSLSFSFNIVFKILAKIKLLFHSLFDLQTFTYSILL